MLGSAGVAVAWLGVWRLVLGDEHEVWGLYGFLLLVVAFLNAASPDPRRPWGFRQWWGFVWVLAGGGLIGYAFQARETGVDPPFLYTETLPPLLLVAAVACFLVASWPLAQGLKQWENPPTCADCGRPVVADPCASCGAQFSLGTATPLPRRA